MTDLTPMQRAYWTGRQASGIAAHLYVELDGAGLDAARLEGAVSRLYRRHPMLRVRVTPQGRQIVQPLEAGRHRLLLDDLSALNQQMEEERLAATRRRMTHQTLDTDAGQVCEFRLSRLAGGRHRLHVDLDMIAADPSCFGPLMDDLARLYSDPTADSRHQEPCYLDVIGHRRTAPRDRDWWRETLARLPAPVPLPAPARPGDPGDSTSICARLDAQTRVALVGRARAAGVTPAALSLAIFARTLAVEAGCDSFRLTAPGFPRPAFPPHSPELAGEFAQLAFLAVHDAHHAPIEVLARDLGQQLAAALSHGGWPAVEALRDLSCRRARPETAPIVFTAGFGLPGGSILSSRARATLGEIGWTISQGPGVALDVQLAEEGDGLLLNWDIRLDLVDADWAEHAFARHRAALVEIGHPHEAEPLGALQRAYLLGRGDTLPLGGVAMQEFREYRGAIPADEIATRLTRMHNLHPALHSVIDTQNATRRAITGMAVPVEIVDLSGMGADEAGLIVLRARDDFAHAICPDGPLWAARLYRMPDAAPDATVAFLRFDGLVLDGFAIAHLCRAAFSGDEPEAAQQGTLPRPQNPERRETDEAWWRAQLSGLRLPVELPWLTPPDRIGQSRYARRSVWLDRTELRRLRQVAAGQEVTQASLLGTVILDRLARWTPDLSITVALPVAPPPGGPLGNRASFIVVSHDARRGTLAGRAAAYQRAVAGGLSHLTFSGVDLARLLLAAYPQARIALPVVLTNGLHWDRPDAYRAMRWTDGLTQTPQVALDLRLHMDAAGALVVSADHALAALDGTMVQDMLDDIRAALIAVAEGSEPQPPAPACVPPPEPAQHTDFLRRIAARLNAAANAPALIQNGRVWTDADLSQRVRAMIDGLRRRGLERGSVLAICLPRGGDHAALQLAAAFEGMVWVPIDAASPPDRLAYMLERCGAALIVGQRSVTPSLPDCTLAPDDLAGDAGAVSLSTIAGRSDDAEECYRLFTSGTTGRPKCVVLCNRATANVIGATLTRWRISPGDRVISVTPLHHDMSVFDIFGALTAGAALVMPDAGADKDAVHWAQLVETHGVTVWVSVPAIVQMLLACAADAQLASLRMIAQGGDYIRPALVAELYRRLPGCRLMSLGGPTETTIWSIWHEIAPLDPAAPGPVPYGQALPGNRYLILDALGRPVPVGVIGRIHSTGVNLALGYLTDEGRSQNDFPLLPDGERAFRSGDMGYWRADGQIMFAGRVDGYVKVRGVRVSLPEVTAELARHPAITGLLVVDLDDPVTGETALGVAYCAQGGLPPSALRQFAKDRLPASHQPSRLVRVAALPLTANGKPDRVAVRALLADGGNGQPGDAPVMHVSPVHTACAAALDLPVAVLTPETPLLTLGLLPRHLPGLARDIASITGEPPELMALAACRTLREIETAFAQHPAKDRMVHESS